MRLGHGRDERAAIEGPDLRRHRTARRGPARGTSARAPSRRRRRSPPGSRPTVSCHSGNAARTAAEGGPSDDACGDMVRTLTVRRSPGSSARGVDHDPGRVTDGTTRTGTASTRRERIALTLGGRTPMSIMPKTLIHVAESLHPPPSGPRQAPPARARTRRVLHARRTGPIWKPCWTSTRTRTPSRCARSSPGRPTCSPDEPRDSSRVGGSRVPTRSVALSRRADERVRPAVACRR